MVWARLSLLTMPLKVPPAFSCMMDGTALLMIVKPLPAVEGPKLMPRVMVFWTDTSMASTKPAVPGSWKMAPELPLGRPVLQSTELAHRFWLMLVQVVSARVRVELEARTKAAPAARNRFFIRRIFIL